jgi:plasmid stabilization system protein ParE
VKLRFTPCAIQDLAEIADYIRERSPAAATRVSAAILESLGRLTTFPRMGRAQDVDGVRKIVARRYRYFAYYCLDEGADEVVVLSHPTSGEPKAL